MDPLFDKMYCLPPGEKVSDLIPMLVVLAVFLLGGGLFRRWRRKKAAQKQKRKSD